MIQMSPSKCDTILDQLLRILDMIIRPSEIKIRIFKMWLISGSWAMPHAQFRAGIYLGDGQTETERITSQGGRGDALLRRMASHLT